MSDEKKIIKDNGINLSELIAKPEKDNQDRDKNLITKSGQDDRKKNDEALDLSQVRMVNDHEAVVDPDEILTDEKADLILTQLLKHQTDDIIPMTDKNGVIIGYRRKLI